MLTAINEIPLQLTFSLCFSINKHFPIFLFSYCCKLVTLYIYHKSST